MSDQQLPPEGRLTDQQRARLRARLMEEASGERRRPWLVPVAAAAAVALLIGGGTVIGLAMTDHGGSGSEGIQPAGAGAASTSPADPGSASPTDGSSVTPSDSPSVITETETIRTSSVTPSLPVPTYGPKGQGSCDREVPDFLAGASLKDEISYGDPGTTYLYGNDTMWVVCDTWATEDGGPPTLMGMTRWGAPVDKDTFGISQNYSLHDGIGAEYVAAGPRIDGVTGIVYTFPTGDAVKAKFVDQMWSMVYLLPDPPNRAWTEPVSVKVSYADGSTKTYDLAAMDLCAQINHGC